MKKRNIYKKSIKVKLTLFVCLTSMLIVIVGIASGYFMAFTLVRNTITADHEKMAFLLSNQVSQMIGDEVHEIHTYLSGFIFKDTMKESNARYQGMKEDAIRGNLMAMDNKWIEASDDSLLMQEYLENFASLRLKERVKEDKNICEMFLTDKFGGLVASSGKTSDFYQADEDWW